jgi:TonB family protein
MGYQALLFCPDEKTARTVAQVLSELDFTVTPCTEPFAAVKKLMGEHFDAVVVDCDNEQNATLLFKSARNAPNNQSALAVAVVEGQAGVAKAFRIGANLVLTKPINVEQAKGTLRVARGLLRKGDAAKPTAAVTPAPPKPSPFATTPVKPLQPISNAGAPRPISVAAAAGSNPAPRQLPQPSVLLSAASDNPETAESMEPANLAAKQAPVPSVTTSRAQTAPAKIVPPSAEAEPEIILGKPEAAASPSAAFSVATSGGSASAAAPARETKPGVSTMAKPSAAISEPESPVEKVAAVAGALLVEEMASPAPSFTFGGALDSGGNPSGAGSKKIVLILGLAVLAAAGAYFAWTQWGHSSGTAGSSAAPPPRPATAQVVPQAVPSAPIPSSSAASSTASVPSSGASTIPGSTVAETTTSATEDSPKAAPALDNKQDHPSKTNSGAGSSKPAAAIVAASPAPAMPAMQPIVLKNGGSQPAASKAQPTSDPSAPSIAIAPADNGAPLPNLMGGANPSPAPVLQTVNVSQGVSQGLLIKKTTPTYPVNALRMRTEGPVQLLATISKTGGISTVKVISGDANLARAAVDAVKQWKYKPYLLDGSPVEMQTQITVSFKLPR